MLQWWKMQNTPPKLTRASEGAAGKQIDEDGTEVGLEEGTTHMNDEIDLEQEYRKHVREVLRKDAEIRENNEIGSEIFCLQVFLKVAATRVT